MSKDRKSRIEYLSDKLKCLSDKYFDIIENSPSAEELKEASILRIKMQRVVHRSLYLEGLEEQ